ncbi:NRDE protein-domain-containing protein [Apodospora peruviana]|uniref:NRDE protein-domain-containing protein n=1 Tax=Apodospora peruviana TaxID=516989 RepID=A0AAE0I0Z0_9PEZI|nr:NRDE protein-domain-containing protein [Apodospora peruviana]
MCIVLLTTSHPKYPLIILDNRDEYILRPTSRPHWWKTRTESDPSKEVEILSSVDLQRPEHGTWLGITKDGNFAVLTNYREMDTQDTNHPVHTKRSRGGMVTAWLGADPAEPTEAFVRRMLESGDVKGVGGFSLICGKLRKAKLAKAKSLEPLAIISNRSEHLETIPWICGMFGKTYGLSNAIYVDPEEATYAQGYVKSKDGLLPPTPPSPTIWPKIQTGADMLSSLASSPDAADLPEEELTESLFKILDTDKFPCESETEFEEGIPLLANSIFIPAFGGKDRQEEMTAARQKGTVSVANGGATTTTAEETLAIEARPDGGPANKLLWFQTGLYGTQRQTVILVDWEGNVSYTERALYDENGNPIRRGEGDMKFGFKIQGWDNEEDQQEEADGKKDGEQPAEVKPKTNGYAM